jgi:hypothetical protein
VKSCETPIEAHIVSSRDPLWLLLPHPTRALEAQICHPCLHLLSLGPCPPVAVTCACWVLVRRHLLPSAPSPAHGASPSDPGRHHLLPQGLGPPTTAPPRSVSSSCVAMDPTNQRSSGAGRRRSVAAAKGHGQQHVPAPMSLCSPSSPDSQQVQSPMPHLPVTTSATKSPMVRIVDFGIFLLV